MTSFIHLRCYNLTFASFWINKFIISPHLSSIEKAALIVFVYKLRITLLIVFFSNILFVMYVHCWFDSLDSIRLFFVCVHLIECNEKANCHNVLIPPSGSNDNVWHKLHTIFFSAQFHKIVLVWTPMKIAELHSKHWTK